MSLLRRRPASVDRSAYPAQGWAGVVGNFASADPTSGEALQSVAVRSTSDLICSLASELPVQVFTGEGSARRRISTPPNILDPGDDGHGLEDWAYRLLSSWLMAGNAYGTEVAWDSRMRATQVDLVNPDDVSVTVVDGRPVWRLKGAEVDPETFTHWRVNPVAGRVTGLSVVELHAATVGVSLSATRFGRQWFTDGAHPSAMLTNSADLGKGGKDTATIAKQRFMAAVSGSREPVVLGGGWDYKPIQITPEESQFLATSGLTEAQCARMFGPGLAEVMGYETGGSMTYANVVDRRQDLLVLTMNKWIRRLERVLSGMLPRPQYVRFNRDALLEATTLVRYQAHDLALKGRWRTVNEVRELEDLPPVEWGNEPNGQQPAGGVTGGDPAGV